MANCKLSVDIDAPVEMVWSLTQNPARRSEWDFRITEADFIGGASAPAKGVKIRTKGSFFGKFETEMVFVMAEPNSRCAVKAERIIGLPFVSGGGSWRYTRIDEHRCRFETSFVMKTKDSWLWKILDRWLLEPFLQWMTQTSLQKMKAVAENDFCTVKQGKAIAT